MRIKKNAYKNQGYLFFKLSTAVLKMNEKKVLRTEKQKSLQIFAGLTTSMAAKINLVAQNDGYIGRNESSRNCLFVKA